MSVITKMNRCADCGSSDVTVENGVFTCRTCGAKLDHGMSAGDLEKLQKLALMGGDDEAMGQLRSRYRNLDITTWSSANRVQQ